MSPRRKVLYKGGGRGDQVKAVVDAGRDRVEVYHRAGRGAKPSRRIFPNDAQGRRAAVEWASAYHVERQQIEADKKAGVANAVAHSHQELWDAYTASPAFVELRIKSKVAYRGRWQKWMVFRGPSTSVDQTTLDHVDKFITAARETGMAVNQIRQVLNVARVVYNWGQTRKLVTTNELALHRWKRPKDAVVLEPEEYTNEEYDALLRVVSPQDAKTWRLWVTLMLAGHHGQRANAVLHLREDSFGEDLRWPASRQKSGEELVQPMTWEAVAALETARYWKRVPTGRAWTRMNAAQRTNAEAFAASPYLLPSHGKRRRAADEPWSYQAMWIALMAAEVRAKVEHKDRRALHGFRKMSAGNVSDRTGDERLGMEWIGDRDMKQARAYLKQRKERMERAAGTLTTTGAK